MGVTVNIIYERGVPRAGGSGYSELTFRCEPACYLYELESHFAALGFSVERRPADATWSYGTLLDISPTVVPPDSFVSQIRTLQQGVVWAALAPSGRSALGTTEVEAILEVSRPRPSDTSAEAARAVARPETDSVDKLQQRRAATHMFAFIQQKRFYKQAQPRLATDIEELWLVEVNATDPALQTTEVLLAVRAALTEWVVNTRDGEKAWAEAKDDLNIADFFNGVAPSVNRYLQKHGIRSIRVAYRMQEGEALEFDESLVDVEKLEEMQNPLDFLPAFLMTDQPPTCPKCGRGVSYNPQLATQIVECGGENCGFRYRLEEDALGRDQESREARRDRLEILAATHGRIIDHVSGKWFWRADNQSRRSRPFDTRWLALQDATEGLAEPDGTEEEDPF